MLRFLKIYDDLNDGRVDQRWLSDIESKDNVFPDVNYRVYA